MTPTETEKAGTPQVSDPFAFYTAVRTNEEIKTLYAQFCERHGFSQSDGLRFWMIMLAELERQGIRLPSNRELQELVEAWSQAGIRAQENLAKFVEFTSLVNQTLAKAEKHIQQLEKQLEEKNGKKNVKPKG